MAPGRKPADPSARLLLLKAARKKAKKGDTLNADELAKVLNLTWRNVKLTIDSDPEFPVANRGGEGVAWVFEVVPVLDHLIARCNAAITERRTRAVRMNRLSGFPSASVVAAEVGGNTDELGPAELKMLGEAQMVAHKLKLAQGLYMPKDRVLAFLLDFHSRFQSEALGLLGKIDPAGQLPAGTRLKVEDGVRTLLVNLQSSMESFVTTSRATTH